MKIIKQIIWQWCQPEHNYNLNVIERIFYTIKALVCYLLNREKSSDYSDDLITVCCFDYMRGFNGEFTTEDWTDLNVYKGIRNWFIDYENNGNP